MSILTKLYSRLMVPCVDNLTTPPRPSTPQGASLLSLIIGDADYEGENWRKWIDLEMAVCDFSSEMNYNALTDGKMKYVHSLYDGSERLFNLTEDHYEVADLAELLEYHDELMAWRARLQNQFALEGRGEMFLLQDSSLAFNHTNLTCTQTKIMDNYPCYPNICGDAGYVHKNAGHW